MRVAVITDTANNKHYLNYLESFAKGSSAEMVNSSQAHKYDCAVIFGSYKKERGKSAHRGKGKIVQSGMPYVQIETQLIGMPLKKFEVPSRGSTIQYKPSRSPFEPVSSPKIE